METLEQFILVSTLFKLINVVIIFTIAWIFHRLAWRIARLTLRLSGFTLSTPRSGHVNRLIKAVATSKRWLQLNQWLPPELKAASELRQERQQTLQELIANAVSLLVFIVAILTSLGQFVDRDTVVWVGGLFGSAVAFAGRTFIGDVLAGLSIIFQDKFDVGEKILVKSQLEMIEGVVEQVSLNATWLRARTGELYIIANAEMRFVCNFSRGLHSSANFTIKVAATDLRRVLPLLKNLGQEAANLLPGLKEPWQVISETGVLGQQVELTLVVRGYFGQAVDLRPQLLALVQERLTLAGIALVG